MVHLFFSSLHNTMLQTVVPPPPSPAGVSDTAVASTAVTALYYTGLRAIFLLGNICIEAEVRQFAKKAFPNERRM